ncbi:MAG: sugar ABC transporter ATP-binding protein [Clostridia bacterium]|nr:sugar ABC transporter ATP-binding protein [Clostridia bacterium]
MLLEMRNICKAFNGVPALRNVDFDVNEGEVHALVGENGAGKSTLIKLLTGVYSLDSGQLRWQGQPLTVKGPAESMAAGIGVIHQDRNLIPGVTAVENAWLGLPYPMRRGRIDWAFMRSEVQRAAEALELELDLNRTAAEMTPPQRTCTEIVRATLRDCRLLVLDEPTAALTDRESEKLFALIRRLRAQNKAVIYISHRLDEVFQLADRITVLKNGEKALSTDAQNLSRAQLIAAMTDDWESSDIARTRQSGEALLHVSRLRSQDGSVREASFSAHAGEILGIFGLGGSGRTELLECVYGARPIASGYVNLRGAEYVGASPMRSIRRGMVLIPEDRRGKALIGDLSVRENVALSTLADYARGGVVSDNARNRHTDSMIDRLQIRLAHPEQPAIQLSGGNQQKSVFARTMMKEPAVFLCDEPTQAVDVHTRHQLHQLLRAQAERGAAVLFVSSDLKELLEVADTILVMSGGRTCECLPNTDLTAQQVLEYCYRDEREAQTHVARA